LTLSLPTGITWLGKHMCDKYYNITTIKCLRVTFFNAWGYSVPSACQHLQIRVVLQGLFIAEPARKVFDHGIAIKSQGENAIEGEDQSR